MKVSLNKSKIKIYDLNKIIEINKCLNALRKRYQSVKN